MTEESGRPGTCRSKVGCDAIEEPWTKRMAPRALAGALADFSQRKSFTGPLFVQCSWPLILSLCPSIASPQSERNVAALEDLASPGIDRQERFVAGREFGLGPGLD